MAWSSRYVRCWAENISCPVATDGDLQLFSGEWRTHERYINRQRFTHSVEGVTESDVALVLFQMVKGPSFTVTPRQHCQGSSLAYLIADMDSVDNAGRLLHDYQTLCRSDRD